MNRNLSKLLLAGAGALVFSAPVLANSIGKPGDNGQYVQFDVPNADDTEATAINNHGTIAGLWEDQVTGKISGFIRSADGTITSFDAAGSDFTWPRAVNDRGVVVGYYQSGSTLHGFLRKPNGKVMSLAGENIRVAAGINRHGEICGYLDDGQAFIRPANGPAEEIHLANAVSSRANGINDAGAVTGSFSDDAGHIHGYLRTADGTITTFDVPESLSTAASRINKDGTISGGYTNAEGKLRYYIRAVSGEFTEYSVSGNTTETDAASINREGVVVGYFRSPKTNKYVAFRRAPNGRIIYLKPPGADLTTADAINDDGVIVGMFATPPDTIGHGYLRLP